MAVEERYTLDVALGTPDDQCRNVIVVAGVDLEVPLEADLDNDPYHDDEVLLEGTDGSARRLTVNDPDVRLDLDANVYVYTFRDVPAGVYRLSTRISDVWAPIASGIVVDKKGASFGGTQLTDAPLPPLPPDPPQELEQEPEEPAPAPSGNTVDPPDYDPIIS